MCVSCRTSSILCFESRFMIWIMFFIYDAYDQAAGGMTDPHRQMVQIFMSRKYMKESELTDILGQVLDEYHGRLRSLVITSSSTSRPVGRIYECDQQQSSFVLSFDFK